MAVEYTISETLKTKNGSVTITADTVEADGEQVIEREIPGNTSNVEFNLTVAFARIRAIGMGCKNSPSQAAGLSDAQMVIKTNSTSTPGNTFTIKPATGRVWYHGKEDANPVTADITKLYISNTGGKKGIVSIYILEDKTPVAEG